MRRLPFIIVCLFLATGLYAQQKEFNVYGRDGKPLIAKLIVNLAQASHISLLKAIQKKDTSNNYITTFYFGNKDTSAVANAKIVLKFNKQVISVEPTFLAAFNHVGGLSDEHTLYLFKAGQLKRDPGSPVIISFAIKSKERVTTDIYGADGELK
ncbi:MAG: hypothetical protein ACTHJ8_15990 [Mucilaginibacter sp.]